MRTTIVAGLMLAEVLVAGCVSRFTYKQTRDELAAVQQESKATAARLQAAQRRVGELQQALNASRQERAAAEAAARDRDEQLRALREQLAAAASAAEQARAATQRERDSAELALRGQIQRLEQDQVARQALERQVQTLSVAAQQAAAGSPGEAVRASPADGSVSLSIVASLLFKSGDSQISPEGRAILTRLKDLLKPVNGARIQIEGHTDNKPLKASLQKRYRSNWELSTARATSVVRFLVVEGGINPDLLSAVGYADTRPVAGNDTEEGRQQNRRIEIVLYPGGPPQTANHAGAGH